MANKIFRTSMVIYFLLSFFSELKAQEVLFPLGLNPVIKEYLKANPVVQGAELRTGPQPATTSLTLPFADDFSQQGIYPSAVLWEDSDAFVNTTFCERPITVGVATLDGIDQLGNPHDPFSGISDTADFLTSKPIDLNFLNDTTIWLSFYYQPQGLGDEPERDDSLTLQFLNSIGEWVEVWSVAGRADTAFQRVNIHITDADFLYDGFRFRFMNYATLNGNRDHWNIDYVWLENNRQLNDAPPDIAYMNIQQSLLREFQSMPYTHYKSLNAAQMISATKTSVMDSIFNIGYSNTTLSLNSKITDESGSVLYSYTRGFNNLNTGDVYRDSILFNEPSQFTFPSNPGDSASFLIRDFIINQNVIPSFIPYNDTTYCRQNFYNYYAYDDGSAEIAFGIPETGAKIAYRFNVKMADTLRGVQIYFNQVGELVHNKLFKLCLWSNVNVSANTDQLVYQMINQKPANIDSINGFATYLFDTILVVQPGYMYIGWIQTDATLLGIGVDRNTVSTSNMYSFYTGLWHQSQVLGSWMMRPLFGDSLAYPSVVGVDEPVASAFSFGVFPNPASSEVSVVVHSGNKTGYDYRLFNNLGELVLSGPVSSGRINVADLSNGFYFVQLTDVRTKESVIRKLVIQHN